MKLRPGTLLVLGLFRMMGMSSCVHDYICQCKISYSGQPGLPEDKVNKYNVSDTKKKAKSACQDLSKTYEKDGIKATETCDLY
jgi:hypothetical protein